MALGQQADRLAGGDLADLDRAGDRGQLELGRADLAVVVQDLDAGRARLLDPGHDGIEVDRVHDDRVGLELDHVLELVELQVGPVLGVERDDLVAELAEQPSIAFWLSVWNSSKQRRDHVVDRALVLGRGRLPGREPERRGAEPRARSVSYLEHRLASLSDLLCARPIKRAAVLRINRVSRDRAPMSAPWAFSSRRSRVGWAPRRELRSLSRWRSFARLRCRPPTEVVAD